MSMSVLVGICPFCTMPNMVRMTPEQLERWQEWNKLPFRDRPLIQSAFSDLTPGEREGLMNGSHEWCFDEAFPEEEDDDEGK